jgi:ribosomal protein S18 acetylase RimI-like enzyme
MTLSVQHKPNWKEIKNFLEASFEELNSTDEDKFSEEMGQDLDEWFDMNEMQNYINHGVLIEARNDDHALIGVAFIGKQNLLTWPDGHKAELFILAIAQTSRRLGIGGQLLVQIESAAREMGAQSIIVNTHVLMETVQQFYIKNGYQDIGMLKNYYDNGDAVFFSKKL